MNATGGPGVAVVTGGAGFVGGYVVRALLDEGWTVHVIDVQPMSPEVAFIVGRDHGDRLHVHSASVEHWPAIVHVIASIRPSIVVHMAAVVGTEYLRRNPLVALNVNVGGTVNVLEAARLFDTKRVVVFSSLGALAPTRYEPIDADHPTITAREAGPTGFYGASKLAVEAFSFAYVSSCGLDVRMIRPSMAYGLGMPGGRATSDIRLLVEGAVEGRSVHLPSGGPLRRGFTHATDVAGLTMAIINGPDDADRVFHAATGRPLPTTAEIVAALRDLVPTADVSVADELSEAQIREARYRAQLDISNARTQLGWSPRYANIRDGLARYIQDFRAYRARSD